MADRIEGKALTVSFYLVCKVVDIHHKADLPMASEALCICRTLLYVFLPNSEENKILSGRGQTNVERLAIKHVMN